MNTDLMKGTTPGAKATMSDSGWSTTSVFKDYMEHHLLPLVRRGADDDHPVLLILDGHSTHTSRQMVQWALERKLIIFVLPVHTSHILQPLDIGVFGPFKRYYYSECAAFMKTHMGKIVTRYDMAELACKAYLKEMTPYNIVSAFRKTDICPINKNSVPSDKLMPCEAFRDGNPVGKLRANACGKAAVDLFLENTRVSTNPTTHTQRNKQKSLQTPNPGGRDITSLEYLHECDVYEEERDRCMQPAVEVNSSKRKGKNSGSVSPKQSTSGSKTTTKITVYSDDSEEEEEASLCCVCKKFSAPTMHERPHLKILNWGQCDKCGHWVHLAFCHARHVLRRGDTFMCQHCE